MKLQPIDVLAAAAAGLGAFFVYKYITKPPPPPPPPPPPTYNSEFINMSSISNYLAFLDQTVLTQPVSAANCGFVLDMHYILNIPIPLDVKTAAFTKMNAAQGTDGFWNGRTFHYVPDSSRMLLTYKRNGETPTYPVSPQFYTYISDWNNVMKEIQTYETPNLFWGGLWGYVTIWQLTGVNAPWVNTFITTTNNNYANWRDKNHERSHAVGTLLQLCQPIPNLDDLIPEILIEQQLDGGWGSTLLDPTSSIETSNTLFTLNKLGYADLMTIANKSLNGILRTTYLTEIDPVTGQEMAGWGYVGTDTRISLQATAVVLMGMAELGVIPGNSDPYSITLCV